MTYHHHHLNHITHNLVATYSSTLSRIPRALVKKKHLVLASVLGRKSKICPNTQNESTFLSALV